MVIRAPLLDAAPHIRGLFRRFGDHEQRRAEACDQLAASQPSMLRCPIRGTDSHQCVPCRDSTSATAAVQPALLSPVELRTAERR
jgi:hypothetical protein